LAKEKAAQEAREKAALDKASHEAELRELKQAHTQKLIHKLKSFDDSED